MTLKVLVSGAGIGGLAPAQSLDRAVWLSNIPHLAAIAILIAFTAAMARVTQRIVDGQVVKMISGARE